MPGRLREPEPLLVRALELEPVRAQEQEQPPEPTPACAGPYGATFVLRFGATYGAWIYGPGASGTSFLAENTVDYVFGNKGGHGVGGVGLFDEAGIDEPADSAGGNCGFKVVSHLDGCK